jgi:hypothetical protein
VDLDALLAFLSIHFDEILTILKPVLIIALLFQVLPLLVLLERRGAAFIQDRQGPQRATFNLQLTSFKGIFTGEGGDGLRLRGFGMLFNIADLVKLLFKESFVPPFRAQVVVHPRAGHPGPGRAAHAIGAALVRPHRPQRRPRRYA